MLEPKVLVNCIHDLAAHNDAFCEWLNAQDDRYLEDYIQGSKDVSEALNNLVMVCADMPESAKDFCMKVTPATVILRKDTNHYYPAAFLPPKGDFCHDDDNDFWWQYEFTFCCPVESDEYNSNLYELKRIMQKTINENPPRVYKTDNGFPIVEILRMQIIDDSEKVITEADQYDFDLFQYAESVKFRFGISETDYNLIEALQYVKDHACTSIKYIIKMPVRDIVLGKTQFEEYSFQCGYKDPTRLTDVLEGLSL
jgi:hypothetical protein